MTGLFDDTSNYCVITAKLSEVPLFFFSPQEQPIEKRANGAWQRYKYREQTHSDH